MGKLPGSRLLVIGTLSPSDPENWWPRMIRNGSRPGRYVRLMQAPDGAPWDSYATISKANPVVRVSASLRKRVLLERDEARTDEQKRHEFKLWRLNRHGSPTADMLLSAADWRRVEARPVAERSGGCALGVDVGSGQSWSAGVVMWSTGLVEAWPSRGASPR